MRYVVAVLFFISTMSPLVSKNIASQSRTRLSIIYFQFNATDYLDSLSARTYKEEFIVIQEIMNANPEIQLGINGYQNTKEHKNLSMQRAQKVKQELMQAGVPENRLVVKQEPAIVVTKETPDDERVLTQKVVFTVVKQTE